MTRSGWFWSCVFLVSQAFAVETNVVRISSIGGKVETYAIQRGYTTWNFSSGSMPSWISSFTIDDRAINGSFTFVATNGDVLHKIGVSVGQNQGDARTWCFPLYSGGEESYVIQINQDPIGVVWSPPTVETNIVNVAENGGTYDVDVVVPQGSVWSFTYGDRPSWITGCRVNGFAISQWSSSSISGSSPAIVRISVDITPTLAFAREWCYTIICNDSPVRVIRYQQKGTEERTVRIFPMGPSSGSGGPYSRRYRAAAGLGEGRIIAENVSSRKFFCAIMSNLTATACQVSARGYKVGESDSTINTTGNESPLSPAYVYQDEDRDSYLYGMQVHAMVETTGEIVTSSEFCASPERNVSGTKPLAITLPTVKSDFDDKYPVTVVDVVFSKEYLSSDNMGDINCDGIPDLYRAFYLLSDSDQDDDLLSLTSVNDDGDYLLQESNPYSSFLPSVPLSGFAPFTASLEIRGYGDALNDAPVLAGIVGVLPNRVYTDPVSDSNSTLSLLEYMAWTDYTNEHTTATVDDWSPERPSDPTKADTDGDGIDDGTEYWWWYRAHVGYFDSEGNHRYATGRRYSVSRWPEGETITPLQIKAIMDPIVHADAMTVDSDGDGLADLLEVEIGTNPFDFDSDGDGLPDGYEILVTGTDPLKMCSSDIIQDQDSVRINSTNCWCDGNYHKIPVDNPTTLKLLWSTAPDAPFSESQPEYSEPGVYTNWCYTAFTPQVESASGDYPEFVVRSGVRMATITITTLADGQHSVDIDGKEWHVTVTDGVAVVDGCDFSGDIDLIIPAVIGGCPVVGIGDRAFYNCASLTSVVIPASVTNIGWDSFCCCTGLKSVTIPASVTHVEGAAFLGCDGLVSVTIPDWLGLKNVFYDRSMDGSEALTNVTILAAKGWIGYHAFRDCDGLESVTIPEGVTNIGFNAFVDCSGLTSVTIPDSMIKVDDQAFAGCDRITSVSVPDRIGCYPWGSGRNLTNVTIRVVSGTICDAAFYYCSSLTSVVIPDGVTNIGTRAFSECIGLAFMEIPDGVTNIGDRAFSGCAGLLSVTMPESLANIGEYAFYDCDGLMSVTIPDGVECVGAGAFAGCCGLSSLKIALSVTNIGAQAFSSCTHLKVVSIPEGVTSVESEVFAGCIGLMSVSIPSNVTAINQGAFSSCVSLRSLALPSSLSEIGDNAFSGCQGLRAVTLPQNLKQIGSRAFNNCTALSTISFPNGVEEIGDGAFTGCAIKSLLFDNENGVLLGEFPKDSLMTLFLGEHAAGIDGGMLSDCTTLETIMVSKANTDYSVDAYGALYDKDKTRLIKYPCASSHETFTAPATLKNVDDGAFSYCNALTEVTFPGAIHTIGRGAFDWCLGLATVNFNGQVDVIDDDAFCVCPSLESLYFAGNSPTWGANQFWYSMPTVYAESGTAGWNTAANSVGFVVSYRGNGTVVPNAWIDQYPSLLAAAGGDYAAAVNSVGANGLTLRESYVAGLDPEDAESKFTAQLTIEDGEPKITWSPDLSDDVAPRTYTTHGKTSLSPDEEWKVVTDENKSSMHFFYVTVDLE